MITFSRTGTSVRLDVSVYIPYVGMKVYSFYWPTPSEEYAGMLLDIMFTSFQKKRSDELKAAYASGYKDGRAKRANANYY